MAYSAPELFLIGAAQNLVLMTSGKDNSITTCLNREYEPDFHSYDGAGLW